MPSSSSEAPLNLGGDLCSPQVILIHDSHFGFKCVRYICEREIVLHPLTNDELSDWIDWEERGSA